MERTQLRTVVGVFEDRLKAQQAINELRRAGFREDQIGIASPGSERVEGAQPLEGGTEAATGAAVGAAAGAGVGALWGLGIVAGVLPAIGPAIAGGTLAAILASAAGGAAAAGLAGLLIGLGIPEDEASYYEGEFRSNRTIVTVNAAGRHDEAWAILQRFGAYDRSAGRSATHTTATSAIATGRSATHTASTSAAATSAAGQTMRLHEEHLEAHKRPVETGEVRVRKEVVTEHQTLEVPVTREEVVIERHPATGQCASSADLRPGEEVRIPVSEEKVEVHKETVAREEVTVGKRKVQDVERVGGTVRKEEVRIEREGDVEVHGNEPPKGNRGRKK